jgi:hypothetical protein
MKLLRSLAKTFSQGFLLKDTNGDGVTDYLDTKIIISQNASTEDIVNASNIAARLGFETTGLDLPLVLKDNEVPDIREVPNPILLGRGNQFIQWMMEEGKIKLEECAAGQGFITLYIPPSADYSAIIVSGGDNEAEKGAANYLAARLPHLWELDGACLEDVERDITNFLSEQGVPVDSCNTLGIVLEGTKKGIKRLKLSANFKEDETLLSAEKALTRLAAEQTWGLRGDRLRYPSVASLNLRLTSQNLAKDIELLGMGEKRSEGQRLEERRVSLKELSLSKLYSIEGLLGAAAGGLIPDRLDTVIVTSGGAPEIVNIAARIGLESTGVSIPIVKGDSEVKDPKELVNPLLVGRDNPWIRRLIEEKKLEVGNLGPREGLIRVVPRAFGDSDALVLLGGEEKGLEAACGYLSERLPHLWKHRKGELELSDIEEDVRRFFSSRTGAGQAATALYRLEKILGGIQEELEELSVQVFVEGATPALGDLFKEALSGKAKAEKFSVAVGNLDKDGGIPIINETVDLPWEVEDLWKRLGGELFPRVGETSSISIEIRVSEPPAIRERLKEVILEELLKRGCLRDRVKIVLLSAYKQGYSWLNDMILPALKGKDVDSIRIFFAPEAPREIRGQTIYSPIRWLQELYPIDEALAKELNIPVENITFHKSSEPKPIYRVEARDREGRVAYAEAFDPKFVIQPLLAKFPDYEKVRVTTGWVRAEVNNAVVLDERVATDPERFWSYYQEKVLGRVFENVMDLYEGAPIAAKAPYFNTLEVELWMSEPDYPLGIDQEQISSLEALHEDLFFETLNFFNVLGLFYSGERLTYPGRIIPRIHPSRPAKPPTVKVKYLGKAASNPKILLQWRTKKGQREEIHEDIVPTEMRDPRTVSALVKAGQEGVAKLGFRLEVDMKKDRREELVAVASPDQVDRQFSSAERIRRMVELLGLFHSRGLYPDALSYPHLEGMEFHIASPEGEDHVELENIGGLEREIPKAAGYQYQGERIVQWEKPISPDGGREIMSKLSTFPEVTLYHAGRSYLGQEVWAMDVMSPFKAKLWSQAKASVYKPTLLLSGRQHANEVSSTSHILRLVELVATDQEYKKFLDRVNIVVHPFMNIDGAALGCELYDLAPHFMLHAARTGPLGVDVSADPGARDPIYPESQVGQKLWRTWLPDIYLNPHGYPSHEWVQLFAGYAGWVQSRLPRGGRGWWIPRGWFMPGFSYIEDPRFPRHKEVAFAIRDYIADAINGEPEVKAMNERMYARRRRWGAFDPEAFKENLYRGVMIPAALRGTKKNPAGRGFMTRYPEITVFEGSTEAPDETASGDWMELVCKAGLAFDLAHLRFLYDSKYEVKRTEGEMKNGVALAMKRERPALPKSS